MKESGEWGFFAILMWNKQNLVILRIYFPFHDGQMNTYSCEDFYY